MINNRQGGRRRGRGGSGGGRQPNGSPGPGNRQDNRQRGNAAQLLEKYKSMARDSQMQGDRVQTEYFLQFADHYYRVLNENRARFEEQRRQRDDYGYDEDEDRDEGIAAESGQVDDGEERQGRDDREERGGRDERRSRPDRELRNGEPRRYRERGEPRDRYEPVGADTEERISLDVLPPSIAITGTVEPEAGDQPAKAPRRRGRRPRDDGDEIAPAA